MEIFVETIERELPDLATPGRRAPASSAGATGRPRSSRRAWPRSRTRPRRNERLAALDRLRLRRARGDRRGHPAARRGGDRPARHRRERDRLPALRARDARARPSHPHLGGAARLELPPLAARLHGARLRRHALARLRRAPSSAGARRVRRATPALRRQMSPLISRLAVVAAGLPIVLGSAYLGGWFLFALLALARADRSARALPPRASAAPARPRRLRRRAWPRSCGAEVSGADVDARRLPAHVRPQLRLRRGLGDEAVDDCRDRGHDLRRGLDRARPRAPAPRPRARYLRPARADHAPPDRLRHGHIRVRRRTHRGPAQDVAGRLAGEDVGGLRRRRDRGRPHDVRRALQGGRVRRHAGARWPSGR